MKKLFCSIAVFLLLCTNILCVGVFAAETDVLVVDMASLLSDEEEAALSQKAEELSNKYKQAFAIVTIDDANGKTAREYADDYYDYDLQSEFKDKGGVLYLIDMDNREGYISTSGDGILYFTDERIEKTLDETMAYLPDYYYKSGEAFLEQVDIWYSAGIDDNQYTYDEETGEITRYRRLRPAWIVGSLLIAGGVFCIVFFSIKAGYKIKAQNSNPHGYRVSVILTQNEDILTNKFVTTRRIPKNTSSGGGGGSSGRSTTHRSSSGSSHGGGGRKF